MPKKSLEKMLEEYTASSEVDDSVKQYATFLAYWDEIESCRKKGWAWIQIHAALFQEGVIEYPYTTFIYYKNKKHRNEMEAAKREPAIRNANGTKPTPVVRSPGASGSTKVELPVFKDAARDPNDRRF